MEEVKAHILGHPPHSAWFYKRAEISAARMKYDVKIMANGIWKSIEELSQKVVFYPPPKLL